MHCYCWMLLSMKGQQLHCCCCWMLLIMKGQHCCCCRMLLSMKGQHCYCCRMLLSMKGQLARHLYNKKFLRSDNFLADQANVNSNNESLVRNCFILRKRVDIFTLPAKCHFYGMKNYVRKRKRKEYSGGK